MMRDISQLKVAVVGATGAVGREMLKCLEERQFPVSELKLFASKKSAGETLEYDGKDVLIEELSPQSFKGIDIALFSAGSAVSREYAPLASENGAVVIDNSSHFRLHPQVPLVVPEVNSAVLRDHLLSMTTQQGMIIANPNCSTIQLAVVLLPIHREAGLKRVVVSTYQSVSGAGKKGMDELWNQTRAVYGGEEVEPSVFPYPIAFNCIPQIDNFVDGGFTKEEMKVINETKKILDLPQLRITATCVRVPAFSCHGESVNIETERPISPERIREVLRGSPGVMVEDDPEKRLYPMGRKVVDTDATYVGRIRQDQSVENGAHLWIVADNLRKGAALNAVQIAEIVANYWGRGATHEQ